LFLAATLLTWSDRSQVHSAAELDTTSFVVIGDSLAAGAGITSRVRALNSEISGASKEAGALVYDLNAAFGHVRASGLTVGDLKLTADYIGGFYSLSGWFPGTTGHAQIANEILALLIKPSKQISSRWNWRPWRRQIHPCTIGRTSLRRRLNEEVPVFASALDLCAGLGDGPAHTALDTVPAPPVATRSRRDTADLQSGQLLRRSGKGRALSRRQG
jgi:hypothetical protein